MRFLVVDDDAIVRMTLSKALRPHGVIDTAENGRDAVCKFVDASKDGNPYNYILLDYLMPVMDGREALHMIRMYEREHPLPNHTTTVFITSGHDDCEKIFAHEFTHDPHLQPLYKPIDLEKLQKHMTNETGKPYRNDRFNC